MTIDPDIQRAGLFTITMLIVELTSFAVGFYTTNQLILAAFVTACCFWCYCCGVLAVHRRARRAYEALTWTQRTALESSLAAPLDDPVIVGQLQTKPRGVAPLPGQTRGDPCPNT
jgi:hypothetical protein